MYKKIPGFDEYLVSRDGKVKSIKVTVNVRKRTKTTVEKELTPFSVHGYMKVNLSNGTKRKSMFVHRLVALTYISNDDSKPHINHIDGNKTNNHVSNLEWCTPSENERHSYDVLGKVSQGGLQSKLIGVDVINIRKMIADGKRNVDIAKEYNVHPSIISNIKRGVTHAT